jgi:AraC-like DNA-binding protein
MRRPVTTLASKALALVRYGVELGIERDRLLAAARLSPGAIERGDARIASASVAALWSELARWTGHSDLGLRVSESEGTSSAFGVVGFRAMTSSTFGEGLGCFVRYNRVVNEGGEAWATEAPDAIAYELDFPFAPEPIGRLMADRALASCLLLARRWTGEPVRPRRLQLRHGKPRDASGYERVFDCAVTFGAPTNAIVFDRAVATLPLRTAQADVAGYLDALARAASADLPPGDAGGAVSEVVRSTLPAGDPGLPAIARKLGVSTRTLQRRLLSEGLSYQGVVDRVRREVAVALVTSTNLPVAAVGERVGYTDDKAFRRAFRRWTGSSPAELRESGGVPRR